MASRNMRTMFSRAKRIGEPTEYVEPVSDPATGVEYGKTTRLGGDAPDKGQEAPQAPQNTGTGTNAPSAG